MGESRALCLLSGWVCSQELTFRPSECRHLGAELLGRRFRLLCPQGTPVRHLWAPLPTHSGGVPEGQDVLDEEGSERFDGGWHLRRGNPQTGRLSLADSSCRRRGWSGVPPRKPARCQFMREQGRDLSGSTDEWRRRACQTETHVAAAFFCKLLWLNDLYLKSKRSSVCSLCNSFTSNKHKSKETSCKTQMIFEKIKLT